MKKYVHLMQALNAPTTINIRHKLSEENYPFRDNKHLKMKVYIYQKL